MERLTAEAQTIQDNLNNIDPESFANYTGADWVEYGKKWAEVGNKWAAIGNKMSQVNWNATEEVSSAEEYAGN